MMRDRHWVLVLQNRKRKENSTEDQGHDVIYFPNLTATSCLNLVHKIVTLNFGSGLQAKE